MSRRSRVAISAVALGYTLLIAAWLMSSQPFSAPDETAHYLRALTITNGRLTGPKAPNSLLAAEGAISREGVAYQARDSRAVHVPSALSPPLARCVNGRRDVRGACTESTYVGNYPPLPYLLPAVALGASGSVASASWLSRLGSALPACALLLLAIAVLWDGTVFSLLGFSLAATPMVLFLASVLSPSGVEIAAAIAFLACLLRLTRPEPPPRWVWGAVIISGAVAILAQQLGPAFVILDVVLVLAVGAGRDVRRRPLAISGVCLLVALALFLLYGLSTGESDTPFTLQQFSDLHAGFSQLRPDLTQAVGTFGALSIPLPGFVRDLWWLLVALLLGGGLWLGTVRQRVCLLAACAAGVLFTTLFYALVQEHTGFGLQGRYMLPVYVIAPMLAGEIVRARRAVLSRGAARLVAAAIGLAAALQLVAWWINARTQAGRAHAAWFAGNALWTPPGGWVPWILAATLGAALIAAWGAYGSRFTGAVRPAA